MVTLIYFHISKENLWWVDCEFFIAEIFGQSVSVVAVCTWYRVQMVFCKMSADLAGNTQVALSGIPR